MRILNFLRLTRKRRFIREQLTLEAEAREALPYVGAHWPRLVLELMCT